MCYNNRLRTLNEEEADEGKNPFNHAIAENVKLQVARLLDETVQAKMKDEYTRLAAEE